MRRPHVLSLPQVAAFYSSYMLPSGELPYTCAQECCNSEPKVAEHNNHQDLGLARMVYGRLLELTQGHDGLATEAERARWRRDLAALAAFPLAESTAHGTVFAEALAAGNVQPRAESNAGYAITHLGAIWPGQLFDAKSASVDPALLRVARNTVAMINGLTDFAPGNGFVLNWLARVVVRGGSCVGRREAAVRWAPLGEGGEGETASTV